MDHKEAIRLQAAEKYVLGELPAELREAYEEHYFECAECALEVKAAAAFIDTSREEFRRAPEKAVSESREKASGGWFFWLRPAFAVPALAVLLGIVGYQNLVTLPHLRSASSFAGSQPFSEFSLGSTNVRGGEATKVQVRKDEAFALDFDFVPTSFSDHYICQLQDETGRAVQQWPIPSEKANQEIHLFVSGGLERSGKYSVVFSDDRGGTGQWSKENQVSRMDFTVEIRP